MKPISYHIFAYWHDARWKRFVGAAVKIRDLAGNLAADGHDVRLFVPKYGFSETDWPFTITEIPLIDLPGLRSISYNVFLLIYLIAHRSSLRPDIVYLRRTSLVSPLIYARAKGVPFFFEVNDDPFTGPVKEEKKGLNRLRSLPAKILDRLNILSADRCFVISEPLIKKIKDRLPHVEAGKMIVMPSGANTDLMHPLDRLSACRRIGLEADKQYIGFVGTLLSHQGLFDLVEAMPAIIDAQPAARCLIVGQGPEREALQARVIQKRLDPFFMFAGEIDYDFLPVWINAMDVCVAPYTADAGLRSPVKIFDYLACGRPVAASNLPGVTDVFKSAPLLHLIPPGSPQMLKQTVCEVLSSAYPTMAERKRSHQWIRDRFDRRIMAGRVSDEADRMLERGD